jgi:hypothetical protein
MKASAKYATNVLTTGFVVLLLLSIAVFWVLKFGQAVFYESLVSDRDSSVNITPSGILPKDIEFDPNVLVYSETSGRFGDGAVYGTLGLLQDIFAELRTNLLVGGYTYGNQLGTGNICADSYDALNDVHTIVYFDRKLGLFVLCDVYYRISPGRNRWVKDVRLYAGPDRVSSDISSGLGRFTRPLIDRTGKDSASLIVFDRGVSRFFRINFVERTVSKGPVIKAFRPIAVGPVDKGDIGIWSFWWIPPLRRAGEEELANKHIRKYSRLVDGERVQVVAADGFAVLSAANPPDTLMLTGSGDIFRLDRDSLEPTERIGALLDEDMLAVRPRRLLGYCVISPARRDERFGTIVGELSANAHQLSVYTFDRSGAFQNLQRYNIMQSYSRAGGPLYLVARYLVENLRPAVLSVACYFTASSFEATTGHQALFLPAESFTGWHSTSAANTFTSFLVVFLIIAPSLLLGAVIAWFVRKDALTTGLSKASIVLWVFGAVAFGAAAGITYLLTRSRVRLVTCLNCGKLRRPDMETCHRCGAPWDMPELRAVGWRVSDS